MRCGWVGVALAVLSLVFVRSAAASHHRRHARLRAPRSSWAGGARFAYLAAVAPILCWHLDDWLGLGGRVIWPGDPVRRVTDLGR